MSRIREIFFELHSNMKRQGPGSNEYTRKVFEGLNIDEQNNLQVLDIGCGPGMQTIELARHINGEIVALDFHQVFLDELETNICEESIRAKIITQRGDMKALSFENKSFDLIWSEGAIYIMGFEEGLKAWRPLIKDGGYLVVSEISWLRDNVSKEAWDFWKADYPSIKNITSNSKIINSCGFELIDCNVLPKEGWWNDYYTPLLERVELIEQKYPNDKEVRDILDATRREIELHANYHEDYSYVFYSMRKV